MEIQAHMLKPGQTRSFHKSSISSNFYPCVHHLLKKKKQMQYNFLIGCLQVFAAAKGGWVDTLKTRQMTVPIFPMSHRSEQRQHQV
jgi:hypothetical protein